jgi:transcription-repair coupling factor (superfamily II helicase)
MVINSDNIRIGEVCDEFNIALIVSDFYRGNKSLFVVLPNLYQAQKYYDALSNYIDESDVLFFPADELLSAEIIAATGDFLFERINTITTLLEGNNELIENKDTVTPDVEIKVIENKDLEKIMYEDNDKDSTTNN